MSIQDLAARHKLTVARVAGEPENPHDVEKKIRSLMEHDILEFAEIVEGLSLVKFVMTIPHDSPEDVIDGLQMLSMKRVDVDNDKAISLKEVGMPRGGMGNAVVFLKASSQIRNEKDLIKALADKYREGSEKVRKFIGDAIGVDK
jgi:hypothetical protein